ncbi:MAG: hypothetical protein H6595_13865 [Flavobacteriales bacterium]|nr:hypothetical protein [Flavobacteriales bacterium]MCB9168553.1 hypothetical protein [Flavobacteriales bacterium]
MRPRHQLTLSIALAALQLPIPTHASSPPVEREDEDAVVLTGWLAVEDLTVRDVLVEVEVNGSVRTPRVSESGRFTVTLPADAEARLRFSKAGHLTKEIVVDTHHLWDGRFERKQRHVRFAIILTLERHMGGLTYAGPVGSIGFDDGGGCVAVSHDRRTVPAKRGKVMVF